MKSTHSDDAISVIVVDDHPLYRDSIARLIDSREDMYVVGQAGDGEQALEMIRELEPSVCVLDYHLPGRDGAGVVDVMVHEHLNTRAIILSGSGASDVVYAMIEKGAGGFLLKTAGAAEICNAIVEVAHGETVIPPDIQGGLAAEIRARHTSTRPVLSERELSVLRLIAHGDSAAEVAEQLNLAPSTVKTHLTRIYDKLGVSERAAAVAQAMRHGIID
jgi:two-component system nitrate/nitrite response regulator NarL